MDSKRGLMPLITRWPEVRDMVEIESERLLLRPLRESDYEVYADFYADEEMARYVGGVHDGEMAWRRLAMLIGHWTLRGFGYWAVEEKQTGTFVGCVGLWQSAGWPEIELGYAIFRDMQGRGYATEAAVRSRDYAFEVAGIKSLVSYIQPDNEASKRVAERAGARLEKTIELLDFGPHCVYRYR
jgi:RimJ/RimL family protein N-acetyltransferase